MLLEPIIRSSFFMSQLYNLEDLEPFALEEFYAIPDQYVQKLSNSMKTWFVFTKMNRGGFTQFRKLQSFI